MKSKSRLPLAVREFMRRARNAEWLYSHVSRQVTESLNRLSPSEFGFLCRQVRPLTMCSDARLFSLYHAVRSVVGNSVPGDIVECGAARGGSAALMALTLQKLNVTDRLVWAFDTFEGLPAPNENDPDYEYAKEHTGTCVGTLDEVQSAFEELGVKAQTKLVKGLFQDTVFSASVKQIAVLHIDGDWYDSVRVCLDALYDRVSPGGVVQFDDYGFWEGARRAVDEFMAERRITAELERIDFSGRRLIKPA